MIEEKNLVYFDLVYLSSRYSCASLLGDVKLQIFGEKNLQAHLIKMRIKIRMTKTQPAHFEKFL